MAFHNHGDFLERCVSCTFTNSVYSHFHLARSIHYSAERIGCCQSQVVVAMGGNDGLIYTIHMLNQIFNLLTVFIWQTITCGVGDVDNSCTSFDDCLNNTRQIFVVGTSGIFGIELNILHIILCIFHGSHSTLDDFLASGVELVLNMVVAGTNTRMDSFALGVFQRVGSNVDIFLNGTRQRTNSRPSDSLRNLNHRVEVTRTRNWKSCLNHIHPQQLQLLGNLNFLNRIQLATWHLFAVAKCCVKNKQSVIHIIQL